jgi:Tfp pilus assembly protein PilN
MRLLLALLVLFGGFVGYGAYRQRQVTIAREERAAALRDSLRRADSVQRVAEAQAAEAQVLANRRAATLAAQERFRNRQADRPAPVRLKRAPTRVYVMKPAPTNRRP